MNDFPDKQMLTLYFVLDIPSIQINSIYHNKQLEFELPLNVISFFILLYVNLICIMGIK